MNGCFAGMWNHYETEDYGLINEYPYDRGKAVIKF
jgi:hypothetical protein